jgi:hypothetical protein
MSGTLNLPQNGLVVDLNQLVLAYGAVGIGTVPTGGSSLQVLRSGSETTENYGLWVRNYTNSSSGTPAKFGAWVQNFGTVNGPNWGAKVSNETTATNSAASKFGLDVVSMGETHANFNVGLNVQNSTTNSTIDGKTKMGLSISSLGPFAGGAGANTTNRGLDVYVSGADVNYAAVFNGGNVGVGTSAPTDPLHVVGTIRMTSLAPAGATSLCHNSYSQIASCSSSLRYKENVVPFLGGMDLVRRFRPASFSWKADGRQDLGLVAEEVATVEPLLVTYNADGEVEGVKYDRINVVLVNALREQQEQISSLQKQNAELTTRLEALERRLLQAAASQPPANSPESARVAGSTSSPAPEF